MRNKREAADASMVAHRKAECGPSGCTDAAGISADILWEAATSCRKFAFWPIVTGSSETLYVMLITSVVAGWFACSHPKSTSDLNVLVDIHRRRCNWS